MTSQKVRVLVIDDDAYFRQVFSNAVNIGPETVLVGVARDGQGALSAMNGQGADLLVLDADLPARGSARALAAVRAAHPDIGVLLVSADPPGERLRRQGTGERLPLDVVERPNVHTPGDDARAFEAILRPVVALHRLATSARGRGGTARTSALAPGAGSGVAAPRLSTVPGLTTSTRPVPSRFSIVVICVSTGGPTALEQVIPNLSAELPVPVLVVQHMLEGFTASLAAQLDATSRLSIREAVSGEVPLPGQVLFAPGGHHLVVRKVDNTLVLGLHDGPCVKGVRPSADVLLDSLVGRLDSPALVVVMTGMGRDGFEGLSRLDPRERYTIAQDEGSCVVYGMPRAVVDGGLADQVAPLGEIAGRVNKLLRLSR